MEELKCSLQGLENAIPVSIDMPDFSNKKILMGFWHNWLSSPGNGYKGGQSKNIDLINIPKEYNVVAVAFMKGSGIPTFVPQNFSELEFRRQVGVLKSQGRAVLISLGGADAHIELEADTEQRLADEIIRLTDAYGFNGLDIDLEQTAISAAANQTVIPAALIKVKEHYKKQGGHFIISMAPEFPYLRTGGKYIPYIKALKHHYDFIAPQYYNQGGDGITEPGTGQWIAQDNELRKEDFLYYLTDALVSGNGYVKIPHNKFVIGLPSNRDAAATGYVSNPVAVEEALNKLKRAGKAIKGLMTWSVD